MRVCAWRQALWRCALRLLPRCSAPAAPPRRTCRQREADDVGAVIEEAQRPEARHRAALAAVSKRSAQRAHCASRAAAAAAAPGRRPIRTAAHHGTLSGCPGCALAAAGCACRDLGALWPPAGAVYGLYRFRNVSAIDCNHPTQPGTIQEQAEQFKKRSEQLSPSGARSSHGGAQRGAAASLGPVSGAIGGQGGKEVQAARPQARVPLSRLTRACHAPLP